ncbi:hypothetical protein AN286_06980 [Aliarcobacter cryaerophilus ATCC 43158]|uniref:Glycosyltransferase, family 1 n=1 Tax=Aliarcobacter cryaerophilus ATCC 43158 TaxID=1032070 RepID=A0AAD0XA23_9BACT|nr:glycosyltransferase family 4 protein [Aliarcobacter cryaerophilus]AYJ79912.1 glycosyltransferase, family 1 [Aliarcobacter cryaerophilus ATCC 43158]PRM96872.1 hypothetical protein CJ667_06600 [Aliarcobacter cryaerophilus]QCZ24144.1 hypothetical protein AN286_06980 [Aliarcobacter cryaerophilus ATCC 43158]
MKILITTEQYYPIKSGVSSVVTAIAEELVKIDYAVYVATGFENRKELTHNGVNIIEFKVFGGFGNYYRGETEQYKEFIKNFECDVMINECVQTWSTDLILDSLDVLKAKKKFLHSHGFSLLAYRTKNPWAYIKGKFFYWTLYKYLKKYDHIFLLHDKTVETSYLNKYGINSYSYLPNGVNEDFIAEDILEKKDKYILNISNYFPLKNQEFLLEAYYKAKTNYKLILIGNSILKDYLNKLKKLKSGYDKEYGVKEVHFLYDISRDKTEKYLEDATIFLHSSKLEVFPMVIVESMGKGIPFLCTDVGNVKELCEELVVYNIDEMASKIDVLLTNDSKYKKLSTDLLLEVKANLNWKIICKNLSDKLNEIK